MSDQRCYGQDSCDGRMHYTAVWDDELQRWVPVDYMCPARYTDV